MGTSDAGPARTPDQPPRRAGGLSGLIGSQVAPRLSQLAPQWTGFVHEALRRALDGAGPFTPAREVADAALEAASGDDRAAVRSLIETHVRMAGAQGLLTNVGGLVAAAVTVPANLAGLAVLQCRMVAAIAHVRGHDLDATGVRLAVLATLLGEERVDALVAERRLPAPPLGLATAPAHPAGLERTIGDAVATELLAVVAGKRVATTLGRRIPVVGGVLGAGTDSLATWRLGRYAEREFLRRSRR